MKKSNKNNPEKKDYNPAGGRPPLAVDFVAVCDAVRQAIQGSGQTITSIAQRFGVSRGWIHANIYPAIGHSVKRN